MTNELNDMMKEYENDPFVNTLLRNAKQRAALMALLTKFLREEDHDLTIKNIKIAICNFFNHLIDEDNMVGDQIDKSVMEELVCFVTQEDLLEQFEN